MVFLAKASKTEDICSKCGERKERYSFDFGSEYNRDRLQSWIKNNLGRALKIEPEKKLVSADLRSYYFGAVLPVVRTTCNAWEKLTTTEIHEIVKKMLFYFETFNPLTQRIERFGRSVMKEDEWNNMPKAMEFLEIVRQYLADCGKEMPDSEEYNLWKNSAPLAGEKFQKK